MWWVESGPCRHGADGGGVAMVERRGALRKQPSRGSLGNGTLAEALDGGRMEAASRGWGIGQRCGSGAAIHAYGKAARVGEICCRPGTFHSAGVGSAEGRQAYEARAGRQAGWLYLHDIPLSPFLRRNHTCLYSERGDQVSDTTPRGSPLRRTSTSFRRQTYPCRLVDLGSTKIR
jgi:hypothetical protein